MKLVNFRGVKEREIHLGDGVTIVEGPNEIGKSSFQDAFDLLFHRKDNASAREVVDAIPHGEDVGPEVEVEIETGPYALVFRKRFRRRAETVLQVTRPKPEQMVGDQAHDRANGILDETLDRDLWERLRVRQDEKLAPAEVGNASALMSALEEISGEGGERFAEGGVLPGVKAQYKRYYTLNRGAETAELQRARADAQAAEDENKDAQTELGELEGQIEKYERLQLDVARLENRVSVTKDEEVKHAEALRVFESVKQRVDKAQTAYAQAQTAETKARGATKVRETLKGQAADAATTLEDADKKHEDAAGAFAGMKSTHDRADEALREAKRLEQEASGHLALAQNRVEYLQAREQKVKLAKRIERIEELNRQIDEANAGIAANPVDEQLIDRVRDAESARREAQGALQAGAPEIAIDALGSFSALVNEETVTFPAGDHCDYQVAEEFRLGLPDILNLRVRPGASLADLQSARNEATSELERLLRECDRDSVEGAEGRARERKGAQDDAKTADTEARTLLGEESLPDLRTQLARLESKVTALSAVLEEPDELDEAAAEAASEEAKTKHDQALDRLKGAQAIYDGLSEPFIRESERLAQFRRFAETTLVADRNASAALADARKQASDESLNEALIQAEGQLKEARRRLAEEQSQLDAFDEGSIRTLEKNSRLAAADAQREFNDARQEYAGARSLVEAGREKGLFERAQDAHDRASVSAENLVRVEARAMAAKRLFEVLTECRTAAYEKHRAPFRERVEKLSRLAFGKDAQVELAEDLTVARRTMDGISLDFRQLSGGTQEQLGLASRLATAMLLGDDGGPLLLDDTLGHSDPERLRGLGAMIGAAAEEAQVVIFTCQPDRFAHVGGAKTVRL